MSSRLSWIALGAGAYLAFAVASFPASVAYRWFAPDQLALVSIEGTVWQGSAAYGGVENVAFSDLRWQLQPMALLTGRLNLNAEARLADGFVRSQMTLTRDRITFRNLTAATRLEVFAGLMPLGDIRGNLSLNLEQIDVLRGWPVSANGSLRVAELAAPPLFPMPNISLVALGNYSARITSNDDPGIVALVNDEGGPLQLEGRASLAPDRSYRLEARIVPRPDATEVLIEGLKFMSPANANGEHQIVLAGSL